MTKNADFPFKSVLIERDPVDATIFGDPTKTSLVGYTTIVIECDPGVPHSDLMAEAYADSLRRSFVYLKVEIK